MGCQPYRTVSFLFFSSTFFSILFFEKYIRIYIKGLLLPRTIADGLSGKFRPSSFSPHFIFFFRRGFLLLVISCVVWSLNLLLLAGRRRRRLFLDRRHGAVSSSRYNPFLSGGMTSRSKPLANLVITHTAPEDFGEEKKIHFSLIG